MKPILSRPLILSLFFFAFGSCLQAEAPYRGRLGVEAPSDVFVDVARESYRWEKPVGQGKWGKLGPEDVDEKGWPKSDCRWIIDFRPCAEWAGAIDDPEAYRVDHSGTYQGAFMGKAVLVAAGGEFSIQNQSYDEASNQTRFELTIPKPGPNRGLIVLEFKNTQRSRAVGTNTGIANFRLLRPGYPADSRQLFTNECLDCFKSAAFSTIRFMGVTNTNGNVEWGKGHTGIQHWTNRKLPEDATVEEIEPLNKKDGWPWEFTIELCNETKMDLWINIPVSVDDSYVRELAHLIKTQLDPALHIWIEHSNEVWNFGFRQYAWNKARAKEEVGEGTAAYNFDQINNEEIWAQRRHAQKLKNAVEIFGREFGKAEINRRIRGVLAGVTPEPEGFFICGRLQGMLDYLKATGGSPKESIYAISMPIYYGGKAATAESGTEQFTVDQIIEGMKASIQQAQKDRLGVVALAKRFELPGGFCAYEGGPDIGGGRNANIARRIQAIRDSRQKELYRENFASGFWELGGNLAIQFTLAGPYSRFGAWGLTDDISHPDRNSLFQAARDLVGVRR